MEGQSRHRRWAEKGETDSAPREGTVSALSNKRLELTPRVVYGMNLLLARRSSAAIR
jgi:hypothetical protein